MQGKLVTGMFTIFIGSLLLAVTPVKADKNLAITLKQAQEVVIENSNEIKALEAEVKAAKALVSQAEMGPNPELEFGMENGFLNEEAKGSINKIEVGVAQAFELGGKKEARINTAEKNVKLAELAFNQVKRELESETIRKIVPIVGLKEQLYLVDDIIAMTKEIHTVIKKRVEHGAAMEVDLLGAEIELEDLTIERETLVREIRNEKNNLKALMGEKPVLFGDVSTTFSDTYSLPEYGELEKRIYEHNDFAVNRVEQEMAQAEMKELEADAVTDLTIALGYERNQEEEANAALFGLAIDLPIFNRNQGEITEKKEAVLALQHESKNTLQEMKQELLELYNSYGNIEKQIEAVKNRTLPKAELMNNKVRELYEKSAVQIFDVIDTQIMLVETKMSIIELKTELAEIAADIYEMTGYLSKIIVN